VGGHAIVFRDGSNDGKKERRTTGHGGRGGAGYPTHLKWTAARNARSDPKYIVCNGDEGDPGAFMDRMIMESYPFRILEGIAIAAYVVGAKNGRFYRFTGLNMKMDGKVEHILIR